MLEFFNPPNLNQQTDLMQGHPENITPTMPCHDRTGKSPFVHIQHMLVIVKR